MNVAVVRIVFFICAIVVGGGFSEMWSLPLLRLRSPFQVVVGRNAAARRVHRLRHADRGAVGAPKGKHSIHRSYLLHVDKGAVGAPFKE